MVSTKPGTGEDDEVSRYLLAQADADVRAEWLVGVAGGSLAKNRNPDPGELATVTALRLRPAAAAGS